MMAIQFIKRGKWVAMASTMIISGVLWYNRPNQSIKGEDMAELYAKIVELNVAYQTGLDPDHPLLNDDTTDPRWPLDNAEDWGYGNWYPKSYSTGTGTTYWWYEYEGFGTGDYDRVEYWLSGATNTFPHAISSIPFWSLLYDKILGAARIYVFDDNSRIYWIGDETFAEGDTLIGGQCDWYVSYTYTGTNNNGIYTIRTYSAGSPSNTFANADSTCDRMYVSGQTYTGLGLGYYGASANTLTNLPMVKQVYGMKHGYLYGLPHYKSSPVIFEGLGNWWTANGLGTDVYSWWCENTDGDDDNSYTISRFGSYGGAMTIAPDTISTPYNVELDAETTVTATSSSRGDASAMMFEVVPDFTSVDHVYFVAGNAYNILGLLTAVTPRKFTVAEGGSTTAGVTVRQPRLTDTDVYYEVIVTAESTGNITASFTGTWGYGNPNHDNWNTVKNFNVTSPVDGNTIDDVGIIRTHFRRRKDSDPGFVGWSHYSYFPAAEIDAEGPKGHLAVSTTILDVPWLGSSDITITDDFTNTTPVTAWVDKRAMVTNLYQAQIVLESFERSVGVFKPNIITYGSRVRNQYSDDGTTHGDETDFADTEAFWDALVVNATADSPTSTTNTGGSFNGSLYAFDYRADYERDTWTDTGGGSGDTTFYSGYLDVDTYSYQNCTSIYPSAWAYTNGYVKKVQLFLLAASSPVPAAPTLTLGAFTDGTFTENYVHNEEPDAWDDVTCGIVGTLASHSTNFVEGSGYVVDGFKDRYSLSLGSLHNPIDQWNLTLLAEVTDPTAPPVFNMGTNLVVDAGYANATEVSGQMAYAHGTDPVVTGTQYNIRTQMDHDIRGDRVVIVVTWNFEHMNKDTPFEITETNSPAWTKPVP